MDPTRWAFPVASQVGKIYRAQPFKYGNDQTLQRFVELSAKHYGFRVKLPSGHQWQEAVENTLVPFAQLTVAGVLLANTTRIESKREAAAESPGRQFYSATIDAVAKIRDPQRRAAAQKLLGQMYAAMAKALGDGQGESSEKPGSQRPGEGRHRGRDIDR